MDADIADQLQTYYYINNNTHLVGLRVLYIVFINGILISNIFLLKKVHRIAGGLDLGRDIYVIVMLTLGDMTQALVSMPVSLKRLLNGPGSVGCHVTAASISYWQFHLPLVCSASLVTISLEPYFRGRLRSSFQDSKVSYPVAAAMPWLVAYFVRLFLSRCGFFYWQCDPDLHIVSELSKVYAIFILLPSVFALVVAVITVYGSKEINCIEHVTSQENEHPPDYQSVEVDLNKGELNKIILRIASSVPKEHCSAHKLKSSSSQLIDDKQLMNNLHIGRRSILVNACVNVCLSSPFALSQMYAAWYEDGTEAMSDVRRLLSNVFLWMFYLRAIIFPIVWTRHMQDNVN